MHKSLWFLVRRVNLNAKTCMLSRMLQVYSSSASLVGHLLADPINFMVKLDDPPSRLDCSYFDFESEIGNQGG